MDDKTFALSLDEPFGLVLEALSKASSFAPFILPARLIKAAGIGPVNDAIGSGPFVFKRDEWAPGSKLVFVRNPDYVGRREPASLLAGNKKALLARIEWVILPDANSATAALKDGVVDMLETEILDRFPERAYQSLPYVPLGQYSGAFAVRRNVRHSQLIDSDVPLLWVLSK